MAGLFIGSLIVDALVPIIGIAWKHHNDDKHKHHSATSDKTPQTIGGDIPGGGDDMDSDYVFETPCLTPDVIMSLVSKRAATPVETPKPKINVQDRLDTNLKFRGAGSTTRTVTHTGPAYVADFCRDFSAVQRTRLNPVTGRIIGYKGIRSKRSLSPTSKYSQFWRDQKYAKTSFHAARSPGIWDSARRP